MGALIMGACLAGITAPVPAHGEKRVALGWGLFLFRTGAAPGAGVAGPDLPGLPWGGAPAPVEARPRAPYFAGSVIMR